MYWASYVPVYCIASWALDVLVGHQAAAKDWTAQGWVPGVLYGSTTGEAQQSPAVAMRRVDEAG